MTHRLHPPRRDGGTVLFGFVLVVTVSLEFFRAWGVNGTDHAVLQTRHLLLQTLVAPLISSLIATVLFALWASGKALEDEPDWRATSLTSTWLIVVASLIVSLPLTWLGWVTPMSPDGVLWIWNTVLGANVNGEFLWWQHALLESVPRGLVHLVVAMPLLRALD